MSDLEQTSPLYSTTLQQDKNFWKRKELANAASRIKNGRTYFQNLIIRIFHMQIPTNMARGHNYSICKWTRAATWLKYTGLIPRSWLALCSIWKFPALSQWYFYIPQRAILITDHGISFIIHSLIHKELTYYWFRSLSLSPLKDLSYPVMTLKPFFIDLNQISGGMAFDPKWQMAFG